MEAAKKDVVQRAEQRMDYFLQQMKTRPQLTGIWTYWFHWYRVRRADWQTRLWLEQLRDWKREIRALEKAGTLNQNIARAERIRKNVDAVQDGMAVISQELDETNTLARQREWRIRFPTPHETMRRWISLVRRRYRQLHYWIDLILEELPRPWKSFVYVIYYAYTSPGAERHLEAHLEGECQRNEKVQDTVKRLANKLLRLWVASPTLTPEGKTKPGYAVPLLQSEMARAPYEGRKISGQSMWQWGVQWESAVNYDVKDHRVVKAEPRFQTKKTVTLRLELFDFDYAQLRKYNEYEVPALWWQLSDVALLTRLGLRAERGE
jgi:hypothetical protein